VNLDIKNRNTITSQVRALRKTSTEAEQILWQVLRDRKTGYKFIRQKPFTVIFFGKRHTFVVDFYCPKFRLAIEADGCVHQKRHGYDQLRTQLLQQQHGLHILRFSNDEIFGNVDEIVNKIRNYLASGFSSQTA
jgi:very-short-patch-repair endonuclease